MLAFSSVEHIGIILLGIGIGGPLGSFGALLHMFNHSMVKSLLFMAAGNIQQKYHTKQIERISGVLSSMPVTGKVFLLAILALAGAPPFNIFISEITIMMAGFNRGYIGVTALFLLMVVLIFAGMIYYTVKMVFGEAPAGMQTKEVSTWSTVALFFPLIAIVVFGVYVPAWLSDAIHKVAVVLQGVY
jgi:hydrogenase-4 component F